VVGKELAMWCTKCGGPVEGWYQQRWQGVAEGPICQGCWQDDITFPGRRPDRGGVDHPEEADPAFHMIRMQRIQNMRKG
jgi:hypothetical protein